MPVSFTQKGYYEVWRDGEKISQHNREREATETITEHSAIHGDGDYEIRAPIVMAKAYGVVADQTGGGDTTPPTTPGSVSAVATSATTGTVTWTASTDNVGVAGYQVFVDGSPVDTTTNLTYPLTGLSPSTQYSVTVTAYDAVGNNSVAGGPSLFTTDANSAPVWSLGDQSYTVGDSVSIDLDSNCTDVDGDTITYSLVSGSLPSGLALSGTRNETLSGTVDTAETAAFTLGASDGIASVQNVALTFTISATDTTAPSAPTNLSVTDAATSVTLDWDDNSESDLASYNVYRSSTSASGPWGQRNASPVTLSTYTDTGLSAGTEYWYYVTAVDDSANESSASNITSRFGAELTGIFVDQVSGSDSYDGTLPVYPGTGTSGPKATVSAGIAACSAGDSLYLTNTQSYGFATYDLDWNSGATSAQAAELAGCYISGNSAFKWTAGSGQSRPVVNFRMRTTNDYFTIHGLTTSTASYTLLASSVWNFTLSYIASSRTGDDTQAGVFWFYNGRNGQRMINIRNCSFTWADGLNWALGTDYVKIDTGYRYGEIANNTFTRAHHDCLGLLGSDFWVHHNTFDNTSVAGTTGYRACSFNVERDLPPDEDDGGEPYGQNLIENNTFISATTPGVENTAPIIKMQNKKTIYRLNTFDAFCSTTNADVFQIQTCCSDPNASHLAPLVAEQRFYNNSITASGFQRWSRLRTWQTDGSAGNTENTRTENHDNYIFNNHFAGDPLSSSEALWEFQQIASAYRVGNVISQNKVEYNTFSNSRTSAFIEDATSGQQTLAQAESNFPGYINNNTVSSSGGAGLGRDLTTTVGAGTSTTLPVSDAGVFMARINDDVNGEVYGGDTITVNGQTATVLSRNLVANTLGLDTQVTWTAGQAVNLSGYVAGYTGVAPEPTSDYIPTHYVTTSALGGGDGSLGNPWTLAEAMSSATAGNVVQIGAGIYTGSNTTSRIVPAFNPSNSGTEGSPIVFVAENPAADLDQSSIGSNSDRTELRSGSTSMGSGCPAFGVFNQDYVRWVGIYVNEADSASRSDTGPVTLWSTTGGRLEKCTIVGVNNDWGDNHCGVRIEQSVGCHVVDCYIDNFGATSHDAGILIYDSNTLYINYNTLTRVDVGISIKGEQQAGPPVLSPPMSVHHNLISCVSGGRAFNIQTPYENSGFYIDIFQNIIIGARFSIRMGPVGANQIVDIRFVNNTFNTDASQGGEAMLYASGGASGCFDSLVFANNIFYDGNAAYNPISAFNFFSTGTFQNNYYFSIPTGSGFVYDGSASRDYAWWVANHEPTASTADPLLVSFGGDDYRLSDSGLGIGSGDSPCLDDGIDILNLLGGGVSASINCGAYILADQSDVIGVR